MSLTTVLMVSFLILLLLVSLPQYANAVLLPNTLTGTSLDTEKPLLPQFEKALDDIKQKESPEQFDARLENISAVLGELITACSNTLTQSLMNTQCDTGMSLSGILCMESKYKEEVFECANPAINDYLKANQITDPDAYVRFGLEKAVREVQDDGSSQIEPELPRPTDFAMKVQLEPHENESARADGRYQVSNFTITISNSSKLCPTGNCEFDLDGGEMKGDLDVVYLDGKLRVNTGDSTKIRDLYADWQTVEGREQDGETVQIIEGELRLGDINMPEYDSQINGTLVPNSNGFILKLTGTASSPYT